MDTVKGPGKNVNLKNMNTTSPHVTEKSLGSLIVWNVSKALEKSPTLNLKEAVISTQSRLEQVSDGGDIQSIMSDNPYERHLACALLAWQQLGHRDADSLCQFVENKKVKEECPSKSHNPEPLHFESSSKASKDSKVSPKIATPEIVSLSQDSEESRYEEAAGLPSVKSFEAASFSSSFKFAMGSVVKLPAVNKIVMRLENNSRGCRSGSGSNKPRASEKDTKQKIEQACCIESVCSERLAAMDQTTTELRRRAGMLARREAERVELLERAEAAWKDLERGYQRRLALAEEKEQDIAKQISKMLEERTNYKNACTALAKDLKDRVARGELERGLLSELEKQVCERACQRMKASEESSKLEASVAELSYKAAQLDRDLLFKEEQARRNLQTLQSEVVVVRAITTEEERATRNELAALRDQIAEVSSKLLEENACNEAIKAEIDDLRQEKMEIIEDLDGCKVLCDGRMQGRMDELIKKREELAALKERAMECRCKLPVSVGVEAKRTASLAGLCKCSPEDKLAESCSCTSMRSKLLDNLFSDLFAGLQSEMTGAVTLMPCQLLKCLEDQHSWDQASDLKTHLKNYFSKLLVEELDIAMATSIENYHAKWVGESCADTVKMTPGPNDNPACEEWQQRAVERRAQSLAEQLAEQLFQERAGELTQRVRDIVQAGSPPCACDAKGEKAAPVQNNKGSDACNCDSKSRPLSPPRTAPGAKATGLKTDKQAYWHQMRQDVTQLRLEVEDLKKGGGPPERDINVEVDRKLVKKAHGKVHGRDTKKNNAPVKNGVTKENVTRSSPVKQSLAGGEAMVPAAPARPWQQAIQDVTQLRSQIEDLKKESITKEDLKMMEDKITKIIQRASEDESYKPKMKQIIECNRAVGASKHKVNVNINTRICKAMKHSGLPTSDIERPANKKKMFDSLSKEIKVKPISTRGIKKPYKKNNAAYAINMCLCSVKRQEQQNKMLERHKPSTWGEKKSKEIIFQMSSSIKQSNSVNDSFISEDFSSLYNKEYDETLCPSKCVCFHKIPSNTSIDKLLETLAKWKGNLDTSVIKEYPASYSNFSNDTVRNIQEDNMDYTSKTSLKLKLKPQEISIQKRQDFFGNSNTEQDMNLLLSNTKIHENISAKSEEPVTNTDSVYIGAVNLEKSYEELCECNYDRKKVKQMPFKCIKSNKCTCESTHEVRVIVGKIIQDKENHKEISLIRTKQEKRVKDINLLPLTPNMLVDEGIKKVQSLEKVNNSKIVDKNTDRRPFKSSDYQIHFLGVTVADLNPKEKNQETPFTKTDNNYLKNTNVAFVNAEFCENKYKDNKKGNKKQFEENYSQENKSSILGLTNYVADIDNNKNTNNEYKCLIDNDNKKLKETCNIQYEYENNAKNNSEDAISRSQFFDVETNSDKKDCYESEDSKFHSVTSENNQSFCKITNTTNKVSKLTTNDIADLTEQKTNTTLCLSNQKEPTKILPCECNIQLDEYKKLFSDNLTKLTASKDVALDAQSLYFKEGDESCVCCSKSNNDECGNLEDNTFHLLEEHLKNKVNQLKASFSVPPEKENNFFNVIVQKVKRLILDSTNEMACKCLAEESKTEGTWNRAYGMLQEYLKLKIEKVQCSCLKDNTDMTLPNVLEKINNLIDYDLQRLKNMCETINNSNAQKNKNNYFKEVNFEANPLNKDKNVEFQMDISKYCALNEKKSFNEGELLNKNSHLPMNLAMDDEYCVYHETNHNNHDIEGSNIKSLHKHNNCDISLSENNVKLCSKNTNEVKIGIENENVKATSIDTNCLKIAEKKMNKDPVISELTKFDSLIDNSTKKINMNEKFKSNEPTYKSRCDLLNSVKVLSSTKIQDPKSLSVTYNKIEHEKSAVSIKNYNPQKSKETMLKQQEKNIPNSSTIPYYGYTITCSCDGTLETCICPKNINHIDPNIISDIWKKGIPDGSFFEKISYILPKKLVENTNQNSPPIVEELKTNNQKSTACCTKYEPIVLKTSAYDVEKSHNETNTYNDSSSVDTNCSNNEDVEWCECSAQLNPSKNEDSDRLKRSIYFPVPIEDFEEYLKDDVSNKNISDKEHARVCDCEMVPLCHVKMLVENIETKLQNAQCTCDSLAPKVCPIHSKMC